MSIWAGALIKTNFYIYVYIYKFFKITKPSFRVNINYDALKFNKICGLNVRHAWLLPDADEILDY